MNAAADLGLFIMACDIMTILTYHIVNLNYPIYCFSKLFIDKRYSSLNYASIQY